MGVLRYSRTILLSTTFLTPAVTALEGTEGASYLLDGEASGFSIDATTYDTITAEVYEGGPVGGTVSVGTSGVFASDNVALDSSILTQAGTSPKMVHFDSAPYVRWTPHNLAKQSQTLGTGWTAQNSSVSADDTTAPDGTSTADKYTASAGSTTHALYYQIGTAFVGLVQTASFYVKSSTAQYVILSIIDNAGATAWFAATYDLSGVSVTQTNAGAGAGAAHISSSITSVGSGWYRITVTGSTTAALSDPMFMLQISNTGTPTLSASYGQLTWNPAGTEAIWAWGGQICRGYNANPYLVTTTAARIGIPQAYDAYEDCFGVLVEPAATNLATNSEVFGSWATIQDATQTANQAVAPDGSTTADQIAGTTANAFHIVRQNVTLTSNASHTHSVYAKYGTHQYIYISSSNNSGFAFTAVFDILNGVVTQTQAGGSGTLSNSSIVSVGNGWYRCSISGNYAQANPYFIIGMAQSATGNTIDGDGNITFVGTTAYWYLWGAQSEAGLVATSYIPTLGSTVTRAKDVLTAPTASMAYSASAGSAYCALKLVDVSQQHFMNFAGALDPNNRIIAGFTDNDTGGGAWDVRLYIRASASTTVDMAATTGTLTRDTLGRIGSAWTANDTAVVANSGTVNTDATATLPTVDTFYLGIDESLNDSRVLRGFIYQMVYLPRRITNLELQAVTA